MKSATVRIGITVERVDSKYIPFDYTMFYCRSRDPMVSDWASEEVGLLSVRKIMLPGIKKMKVGETKRFWVHARLEAYQDYWGECDSDFIPLKIKVI